MLQYIIVCLFIVYILYLLYNSTKETLNIGLDWFSNNDMKEFETIEIDDLHGYVLPHAGTRYTGNILSHTLRFKPKKKFTKVIILYLPSSSEPNVGDDYHEHYVPYNSIQYIINNVWKIKNITYEKYNIIDNEPINYTNESIVIVSADFSHFLDLHKAIELENKAAHAIMHRELTTHTDYIKVIDHVDTFKKLYEIIPKDYILQWVGRTRSEGEKGVGYLSFLLRNTADPNKIKPDGLFITAYDEKMQQRECLGEWKWSPSIEENLKEKVIRLGGETSRLTGGQDLDIPITNYTVTYLYEEEKKNKFIRGWHNTKLDAFFLSDVYLENTFDDGTWIQNVHKEWKFGDFKMDETRDKLSKKAGYYSDNDIILYNSRVKHVSLRESNHKDTTSLI